MSRARADGGPPFRQVIHGVFTRQVTRHGPLTTVFELKTPAPQPDGADATFSEPPSCPRFGTCPDAAASCGTLQPVWRSLHTIPGSTEIAATSAWTTGMRTTPFGSPITGMGDPGAAPGLGSFALPGLGPAAGSGGAGLPVTAMSLERDGFRGDTMALTVSMGTADAGWAKSYLTSVPAAVG